MDAAEPGWPDVERLLVRAIGDLVARVRAMGRRPERLAAMREEPERMHAQVRARRRNS